MITKDYESIIKSSVIFFCFFQDANPKGEVFLGYKNDNFAIREGVKPGDHDQDYSFTLHTPDRDYVMSADTKEDRKRWMEALRAVINTPLNPKESIKVKRK